MKSTLYLALIFVFLLPVSANSAEEQRYRIELLLVRHLDGLSEWEPVEDLNDFSDSLDLTPPVKEEPLPGDEQQKERSEPPSEEPETKDGTLKPDENLLASNDLDNAENSDGLEDDLLLEEEPEPVTVLIESLSDPMQQAWRRLRLSATFRPELSLAWEQAEFEPFPLIRFHDSEVLIEDDPYTELRVELEKIQFQKAHTFTDTNTSQNLINGIIDNARDAGENLDDAPGDEEWPDCEEPLTSIAALEALTGHTDSLGETDIDEKPTSEFDPNDDLNPNEANLYEVDCRPVIPDSTLYYRVDGTARLRKSRFLHLDLNIEMRETLTTDDLLSLPGATDVGVTQMTNSTLFRVYKIEQSRQVQTQDIEYFDGPVIGVLALITRIEVVPEPEADEAPIFQ